MRQATFVGIKFKKESMLKFVPFKKIAAAFLLVILMKGNCYGQVIDKEVYKKYRQYDSTAVNNAGILVFYTDNTFINYGILKDLQNQEAYVWYTYGKWTMKNGEIICKTYFEAFNQKKMIDEIKASYRTRLDYRLIDSYYEFEYERYLDYSFIIMKDKAFDASKKIEYTELKNDAIKRLN